MLIITGWNGRYSNNILQIIRTIQYAIKENHNIIRFPKHEMFKERKIFINNNNKSRISSKNIKKDFFNERQYDLEPYEMKELYKMYILPILKYDLNFTHDYDLVIHIRGGDVFSTNPHKKYHPPPLDFYKKSISYFNSKKILIVSQDKKNPCVDYLLNNYNNTNFQSSSLINDLKYLTNCENLVIGQGTFGLMLYFSNFKLKNLFVPEYVLEDYPKGSYNVEKIITSKLSNYIEDWRNTKKQRDKIMNYKIIQ